MKELTRTRKQSQVKSDTHAGTGLDAPSTIAIGAMGAISTVAALWALALLVSATIGSGGLLALTKGWLQAITGM